MILLFVKEDIPEGEKLPDGFDKKKVIAILWFTYSK